MNDIKYLIIEFPNGDIYHMKAYHIAEKRAIYYADWDHDRDDDAWKEAYHREKKYAMENHREIINWAANNMDWGDVEEFAELIFSNNNLGEMWSDATFKVESANNNN